MVRRLLLLAVLILSVGGIRAQEVSKNVQRADRVYNDGNYDKALEQYLRVASEEAVTAHIARQIGNCYRFQDNLAQAEIWYEKALKQPDHGSVDYLLLGYAQKANGKVELAAGTLKKLYALDLLPNLAQQPGSGSSFDALLREGFLSLNVVPVSINSSESDFSPTIYRDALVFATSRFDRGLANLDRQINPQQHLSLYTARLSSSGELGSPFVFSNDLLSPYYTGPIAFSPSGDTAYFVRKKYLKARRGDEKQMADNNLKILRAIYNHGEWIDQGPLPFCTDSYSVGDPAVSPDGKRLYFTSDMPGGMGGADLYYREIRPGGTFGDAVNLGAKINTAGNEMCPFVAKDGTLFFASDGLPGFGNLDLFAAYPTANGFDYVTNLGYPVNGAYDDFGLTLSADGTIAFFSSNRPGGMGDDDIYKIEVKKIVVTHTLDGQVVDEKGAPVVSATIKVMDGDKVVNTISTDAAGKFTAKLDDDLKVSLHAQRTDYFPTSVEVNTFGLGLKPTTIPVKITMTRDIGYTLTATILSLANNSPIAGARAIAFPPDTTKALVGSADQLGRVRFKLDKDTDYRIRVEKEGFISKWFTLSTKGRERGDLNLSTMFDTRLQAVVKPGLTGKVTDAKTGLPLENVVVTLTSDKLPQPLRIATDNSGQFNRTDLPEGVYSVKLEKDGYSPMEISLTLGNAPFNVNSQFSLALQPANGSFTAVGLVTNKDDGTPIKEVVVTLLDKATNEKVQNKTDDFGSFDFRLDANHIYILKLEKEKFFAKTLMISTQGVPAGMFNLNTAYDLKMEPIVMNKAIEIPNIYYDLGKWDIKPESAIELDKLVTLLEENPTIRIELSSHTDARGSSQQNMVLSQKRAQSAVDYIVSKGIASSRIVAKGYGDTMIKNRCKKGVQCTEAEQAVNRRTEIKVISY